MATSGETAGRNDQLATHVGRVVRRLRTALGVSQEYLANVADVTATRVSEVERGVRCPTLARLEVLAVALGTTPGAIVDEAVRSSSGSA